MSKTRTVEARGPEYLEFGSNLAELRKARGLSQVEIASSLGIMQSTYAGWETGTRKVQLSTILRLANFFGVSVDILVGSPIPENSFAVKEIEVDLISVCRKLSSEGRMKLYKYAFSLLSDVDQ